MFSIIFGAQHINEEMVKRTNAKTVEWADRLAGARTSAHAAGRVRGRTVAGVRTVDRANGRTLARTDDCALGKQTRGRTVDGMDGRADEPTVERSDAQTSDRTVERADARTNSRVRGQSGARAVGRSGGRTIG